MYVLDHAWAARVVHEGRAQRAEPLRQAARLGRRPQQRLPPRLRLPPAAPRRLRLRRPVPTQPSPSVRIGGRQQRTGHQLAGWLAGRQQYGCGWR
jgi:hypothetical protein|eukprot:COSAG01_NODE_1301_length_10829_cov_20.185182_12_plen_95_part_00